jgi:hypothetical protein
MKLIKSTIGLAITFLVSGCVPQYTIDPGLEKNSHVQVIVNDFMDYLKTDYRRGQWIEIKGGEGNKYIAKLRATAIRKGLKVCINNCPQKAISFETLIEKIDGNLLEATMSTPKSTFHRIYKLKKNKISRFGNKTVYRKAK